MHDLYFANRILEQAQQVARAKKLKKISIVEVEISPNDFLSPEAVLFLLQEMSLTTMARNAQFQIKINKRLKSSKLKSIEAK